MPEAKQKSNQVKSILIPKSFDKEYFRNLLDGFIAVWLLLIIGLTTWQLGGVRSVVMMHGAYFMGILLIAHSLWLILHEKSQLRFNPWALIFIPFLLFVFWSWAFWSPTSWLTKRELFLYLQGVIIFWILLHNLRTETHFRFFIGGLFVIALGSAFCAFYQFFRNPTWLPMGYTLPGYDGRATGTFGTPNNFAALMNLAFFPLVVGLIVPRFSTLMRVFCGIGAFFFGCALIMSMSRGGLLSFVIGLSVLPYGVTADTRRRKAGWIILIACVLFGGFFLYHHMDLMKLRTDLMMATKGAVQSRLAMWSAAWNIFLEHPGVGSGGGSYNLFFEPYRPIGFSTDPIWVHNDYLNILSDYGLVGFILFYGAVFLILKRGYSYWKRLPFVTQYATGRWSMPKSKLILLGFGIALMSFGVHIATDFHLKIPALVFWAAAYLAIILRVCTHRTGSYYAATPPFLFVPILGICGVLIWWAVPTYQAGSLLERGKDRLSKAFANLRYRNEAAYNKETFEILNKATELEPGNADIWAQQSYMAYFLAYNKLGEDIISLIHDAQEAAQKSLAISDQQWFPNICLGLAFLLENKKKEAGPYFEIAVKLAPNNSQAWYYYAGYLALDKSRPDRALEAINYSLKLNNRNHEARLLKERLEKAAL